MLISVVVATYNRADRIALCLEALCNQSYTEFEIIVSDDGSDDDTEERVAASRIVVPTMFTSHEHTGWGLARTRNQGASFATGDMLVFIDSDILLNPGSLANYARLYAENRDRVIAGYYKYLKGMVITPDDVREWDAVWKMALPDVPFDQSLIPLGKDVREARFQEDKLPDLFADENKVWFAPWTLLGGNMGIPRHIWDKTDGFDEGITFYGGEDGDMSCQVLQAGYGFSFSRSVGGAHMAHPKAPMAATGENDVMDYMRAKWPQYL